jgi:multidrug resistance efflux pump
MAPLSQPHDAPQSRRGILELYAAHLHTTRSTGPRSLESPVGTVSALYIFVGILISLCIAAPVIARLRRKQENNVADYIKRAKRAAVEVDGRVAELAARLVQEQEEYQTSRLQHENQLQDERLRLQTLQQQIGNREEALTVAQRERDTAREEAREARQLYSTTSERIQTLENEVRTKEEGLRSLQQRYNHVDQEYRRLIFEMPGSEV